MHDTCTSWSINQKISMMRPKAPFAGSPGPPDGWRGGAGFPKLDLYLKIFQPPTNPIDSTAFHLRKT